ncbi:MAG: GHKL domain-containing protein, partial [Candidatus Zixiibacteriota bacterium]
DEAETAVTEYERTIAELRRLHEALKQRAESLEQFNQYLLTSMDAGVVTFDPEGKLKTINPAAQRLLKVADVSEGSPVSELFRSFPELNTLAGDLLREGGEPRYREVRCRSGEEDTVFGVLATRIVNDNGQQVGCALLLNDLTELYRLRANLEQKTRLAALGEMAAGLAHQIRNSLGAITGFARLIGRRADNEQLRRTSDNLVGEAEQAGELIERFLSLARPLDIQAGSVEIVALLRELVSSFAVQTGTDSITFSVTGEPELYVQGDALLLKQVFGNLLDNAIKACANRQAAIVVDIQSTSAGKARVTVTDDGPGIPKEDIDKLFTPFFSTRPSGTGLGLSLVAKIVDAHHGAITVDSTVGEGTTVVVHLPLYVHAGTESVPSETVSRS